LDRFGKVEDLVNMPASPRCADDGHEALRLGSRSGYQPDRAILLTQALLRPMIRTAGGRIVNMASVVGRAGQRAR